jgi:hypothetical protein
VLRNPAATRAVTGLLVAVAVACGGPSRPALRFEPDRLSNASVGKPYIAALHVRNNSTPVFAMNISMGVLPPGVSLAYKRGSDSAEIRGTPTKAGHFSFAVSAMCFGTNVSGQTGEKLYEIDVTGR